MSKLPQYLNESGLPQTEADVIRTLGRPNVKSVRNFCLGPATSNIPQACRRWLERAALEGKAEIILCDSPEESLERASQVYEPGVVPLFWTCAVFVRENRLFFENPDTFMFFVTEHMKLDSMQLAARPERFTQDEQAGIRELVAPSHIRIASHPSPAPLVQGLANNSFECDIIFANSNGHAAEMCSRGVAELCITTESAARQCGLRTIHVFGSPLMVFFGGLTRHGAEVVRQAYALDK